METLTDNHVFKQISSFEALNHGLAYFSEVNMHRGSVNFN